jgi:hypothetical protein
MTTPLLQVMTREHDVHERNALDIRPSARPPLAKQYPQANHDPASFPAFYTQPPYDSPVHGLSSHLFPRRHPVWRSHRSCTTRQENSSLLHARLQS